jgi:hypothetical protein
MDCEVGSFGRQKTVPLLFGKGQVYRATMGHQWHTIRRERFCWDKVATYQLQPGRTRLPLANLPLPDRNRDFEEGYAHGFVYGDGWEDQDRRGDLYCDVALFKEDNHLIPLLVKFGRYGAQKFGDTGYTNVVRDMPGYWKLLPKHPSKSYSLGFVLGLVSADGTTDGSVRIFQSDPDALDEVRKLAIFAGLRTGVVLPYTEGGYEGDRQGYVLTISRHNLTADLFLRRDQREAFRPGEKSTSTSVSRIGFDDVIEEEVFCAVVPEWHNFTLANGVITGNCFAFIMRGGAWALRRFTPGVAEHPSWTQDGQGWTQTYYNRNTDLDTASKASGGIEHKGGGYVFAHAGDAVEAARHVGVNIQLPAWAQSRRAKLKESKDGRLVVEIDHDPNSDGMAGGLPGWLAEGKTWSKVFHANLKPQSEVEVGNYDDVVRHLVSEGGEDAGWCVKSEGHWVAEPIAHVKLALQGALGLSPREATAIMGSSVFRNWKIVNYLRTDNAS